MTQTHSANSAIGAVKSVTCGIMSKVWQNIQMGKVGYIEIYSCIGIIVHTYVHTVRSVCMFYDILK